MVRTISLLLGTLFIGYMKEKAKEGVLNCTFSSKPNPSLLTSSLCIPDDGEFLLLYTILLFQAELG